MDINVKTIKFDATDKLQEFIQKKVGKLDKYCNDIRKVEVSLKVVKPETALNKEAVADSSAVPHAAIPVITVFPSTVSVISSRLPPETLTV